MTRQELYSSGRPFVCCSYDPEEVYSEGYIDWLFERMTNSKFIAKEVMTFPGDDPGINCHPYLALVGE